MHKLQNAIFIFDVDGPLCEGGQRMDESLANLIIDKVKFWQGSIVIVSGSRVSRLLTQLPENFVAEADYVFGCLGNETWSNGTYFHVEKNIKFPNDLMDTLDYIHSMNLNERVRVEGDDNYYERLGECLQYRPGMVNFSLLKRHIDAATKHTYSVNSYEERWITCSLLTRFFPTYDFSIGGSTSIDITPVGKDKSQIKYLLDMGVASRERLLFADRIEKFGNDHTLAKTVGEYRRVRPFRSPNVTRAFFETI